MLNEPVKSERVKEPLRMLLKDGRSIVFPNHEGLIPLKGGAESLRERDVEIFRLHDHKEFSEEELPSLEISAAGEIGAERSPWANKKFLWFCKYVGVSVEGFEEDIMRILVEIENRRCSVSASKAGERGTMSSSRKERELKKLISTINYDGAAGREAEVRNEGRQISVIPK